MALVSTQIAAPSILSPNSGKLASGVPAGATGNPGIGALANLQDPSRIATTLNGVNYNYGGDVIPAATPAAPQVDQTAALIAALKASNAAAQETAAPTPDFNAINANAAARASADVNPIYTKYLNDFLGGQAQAQATQKAITEQNIQNAQDTLKNTQDTNAITQGRTAADTQTKEAQAAQATDWRQTDQGGQYDIDRVAQAIQQAKAGTAGSGIGAGEQTASQTKFNTTESRQATQDAQQKQATELAQARTFEDLARSNTLAGQQEGKQEKAANFDLTTFIQGQSQALQDEQQKLEEQRQQQVSQVQSQFVKSGFQDFFNSITNPAQKAAFAKAYGNQL